MLITAQAYGIVAPQNTGPDIPGVTSPALQMVDKVPAWLEEHKLSHRSESHALMKQMLKEFQKWVKRRTIASITLRFKQHLLDKGRSMRPNARLTADYP